MRTVLAFLIAALMLLGLAGEAFAQPPAGSPFQNPPPGASSQPAADASPEKKSLKEWEDAFTTEKGCWGCKLVVSMADVTYTIGQKGESVFNDGAIKAMPAFFGLWLMFQLIKMISVSHANSPVQSINEVVNASFLFVILLAILNLGPFKYIMHDVVFPIMSGVLHGAQKLVADGSGNCGYPGQGQSADLGSAASGLMCSMHRTMGRGLGLGMWLMATAEFSLWSGKIELLQFVGGLIIVLAFGMMMILLPFRLFDALIRIAVVAVILPAVILAGQFKISRGVVKQAVTSVVAAALMFLFSAIAVAISIALMEKVTNDAFSQACDACADQLIGPLDGSAFMILVAASIGLAAFILQAGNLASEFAGFQGHIGSVGAAGAATVGGAAVFAAKAGGHLAGRGGAKGAAGAQTVVLQMRGSSSSGGSGGGVRPGGVGFTP